MRLIPLFMENENWFTTPQKEGIEDVFFEDGRGYHLTDEAPQEAIDSYNEFYAEPEFYDENGNSFKREGWHIQA
ncbi:hypothetical protein [Adlercreutzia agrestimuris]|uniref:hypothetical protein n=1 Tax=Adlercreutzia agrestimuris TaxID=2941324 RepID=UPI00203E4383|nr:hypothetical protein [Adlercreutzia agrestimuris]